MSGELNWSGLTLVAIAFGVFLLIGWWGARKSRSHSSADLILAGRAMPLWIAVMTMTATWVDGGYINGTAEATFSGNLAAAFQPGFCFGISLILGGIFFAHRMRRLQFATLIDPFEIRFGKRWASVLFLPAMLGELFWSGALLVAIATTFKVLLGLDLRFSVLVSAAVVTFYTMCGGMWSVAFTDSFQLILIPLGLCLAIPFALDAVGGMDAAWAVFQSKNPETSTLFPPLKSQGFWTSEKLVTWWDASFLLVLGGIPWNCYFQRVLSCSTPARACWHSILAGVFTILLTIPPMILGIIAAAAPWSTEQAQEISNASLALPMVFRDLVPTAVGLVGLLAILGAVTSSYSSSILSAGTMLSWNVYRPLISPHCSDQSLRVVIRVVICFLGLAAVGLALQAEGSVYTLWTFSADLVFVLLFPQLVMALYDPRTNRMGSIAGFVVSLGLRLGGGEELFGIPNFLEYPPTFPYKTVAAATGFVLIPVVSRLTAKWNAPRPLEPADEHESFTEVPEEGL